jgi:hypothetical protein
VSKRAASSLRPEISICLSSETPIKSLPSSLAYKYHKPMTLSIRLSRYTNDVFSPRNKSPAGSSDFSSWQDVREGFVGYDPLVGSLSVKLAPRAGVLSTVSSPSWARARSRAMESPKPVPPPLRVRASSVR